MADITLAVLPFADLSPEQDQAYFCTGISEELLDALGKSRTLRCIPRPLSATFGGNAPDMRAVGTRLQASHILHGSVRRGGARLMLEARLVDVANERDVWTEKYERAIGDLLTVLDDIVLHVLRALGGEADQRCTVRYGVSDDPRAYDAYLQGLAHFHEYGARSTDLAITAFHTAVDTDPSFARAWTRLADSYAKKYMFYDSSNAQNRQRAAEAARKAVELAPDYAQAHTALGVALTLNKDFMAAEAAYEKAIELDPKLYTAYYHYARACFQQGRLKKSAELFEKAAQARPQDYQVPLLLRQVYLSLGEVDKAIETARHGIQLAVRHLELYPNDARAIYLACGSMIQLGMYKQAIEWAGKALAIDPTDPTVNYNVACCYSQAGEYDKALDCLEKAKGSGVLSAGWLKNDSDLIALHDHPRFRALLEELEKLEG
ncbi:MAG TPA: tetratricopeptide repeat protein [Gammaproteobacteria bacterium]|nr:tetratricopeptide repeat protein [Gammaproteobacteria bacterium]